LVLPASVNWSEVKVTFNGPTSTGDYNHNGIVDAADYTVWRASLGSTTDLAADGNGNNTVDADDYNVWKAHFGESNSGGGSAAEIPEPAKLSLTMIACFVSICGALRIATK
jgi:hypothetical protein